MTKIHYNYWLARLILFKGYSTITLGPFILTIMKEGQLPDYAINEERIHVRQWKDCFTMGMIIAYFASFLFSAPYHWYAFLPFLQYVDWQAAPVGPEGACECGGKYPADEFETCGHYFC